MASIVRIQIDNREGRILTPLNIDQLSVISTMCSFKVENSEFKASQFKKVHRGANWDGVRRLFNAQTQKFPIGLLHRIMHLFDTVSTPYELVDNRTLMTHESYKYRCSGYEPREYQSRAVFDSMMGTSGIVKAATGSGKTTMAAMTIEAIGQPSVFIVHTKDLLYQAKGSFERLFQEDIGQIGDGVYDPKYVTVATMQSLAVIGNVEYEKYKYDEDYGDSGDTGDIDEDAKIRCNRWLSAVGLLMFDEVQRVASRTAYGVRFMFPNINHAFGYSASPWRDDGSDLMIEASFGPILCNITASELITHDPPYLVRPYIHIKPVRDNVWSGKDYTQIYRSAVVENMFRNIQVVQDAMDYYDRGMCTLVLVTQIKHGEMIESMLRGAGKPAQFISGRSGMRYRRQVIDDMRNGKAPLIIASTIADVGLDVPRITAMVEAGAGKSSVTALQRVGREMRLFPGKTECHYTTYRDTAPYLREQIDNKIAIWNTEKEFRIIEEV